MMEHKGTKRLETERLILRPFEAGDGPAMFKNWCSDPDVTKFLTWPTHTSVDVSSQLAAKWAERAQHPDRYQWAIVPKALGEPAGSIAVVDLKEEIAQAEIGYCLGKNWWGNGWTTEAVREVIRYLIQEVGFNRIEGCHDTKNPGSGRVMQKAGMTFEGVIRDGRRNNQGICDVALYSILAREWHP